ncbi:MAG: hypothetical protein II695_12450, partial [Oscillospiraceae bacterium]|nr:hypothetical protein [Oscillospiraceae bacterium]
MTKKGIYHWMITVIIFAVIFVIPLLHPSVRYRTAAKNDKICISVKGTGSQGIGYRQIIRGDDILAPVEDFDKSTGIMTRILGKKYRAVQQGRCDLYMYRTIGGGDIESLDIYHISANEKHKITYTVDSGEPLLRGFDFYYYPAAGDSIHINSTVISDDQMLSSITDDLLTVAGKHTECSEPDTSGFDHICIYH